MSSFSSFIFRRHSAPELRLPPKIKYHYEDPHVVYNLSQTLKKHLAVLDPKQNRPLIVLGIGTDRSTGDSLGPLVGTKLQEMTKDLTIYGSLDEPVHASNLEQKLKEIGANYDNPLIIAVDACLGLSENIGFITLAPGSLKPGAGVHKNLPPVGHVHFTGTVNVGGYMEYFVLQNTRLNLVMKMANKIALSIYHGCLQLQPVKTRAGISSEKIQ
ncbi:spore protease YyaC [Calderihabitans maritimus]|uniref:Sporulation protein YyaC n=1 Tax=Calderihabitans maritimus TaxID=1246530 RepID=A0A1Z5HVU0_9FIRM|nr:spore protease YyaC [Calderihabitans maritimus]GAW93663.1 hypothetical protein Moth_2508 [Calderihabitans maritimus]